MKSRLPNVPRRLLRVPNSYRPPRDCARFGKVVFWVVMALGFAGFLSFLFGMGHLIVSLAEHHIPLS